MVENPIWWKLTLVGAFNSAGPKDYGEKKNLDSRANGSKVTGANLASGLACYWC